MNWPGAPENLTTWSHDILAYVFGHTLTGPQIWGDGTTASSDRQFSHLRSGRRPAIPSLMEQRCSGGEANDRCEVDWFDHVRHADWLGNDGRRLGRIRSSQRWLIHSPSDLVFETSGRLRAAFSFGVTWISLPQLPSFSRAFSASLPSSSGRRGGHSESRRRRRNNVAAVAISDAGYECH